MAAGDAVQLGEEYLIGFGETYYLGYCVESLTYTKDADSSAHKDCRGATDSILTQDPRNMLDVEFSIKGMTTEFAPPDKDALVSIKSPDDSYASGYRVESAIVNASSGIAVLSMSLVLEDSMGATFDDEEVSKSDNWNITSPANQEEVLIANGASDISAVYGDGVLLTKDTDWAYDANSKTLEIISTYLSTVLVNDGDTLILKILPNYGEVLTLDLTGEV